VLVPLQGLVLPVETWERDVLPRRTGAYSQSWLDSLCASGEVAWVGAGALGRSGRVALYFREDAAAIGPPAGAPVARAGAALPSAPAHEQLRARLALGPCFFTDLLAELDAPAEALREALWDLVWAGEVTNDAWAPLRAPRLALAQSPRTGEHSRAAGGGRSAAGRSPSRGQAGVGRSRFAARRSHVRSAAEQVQGRWSLSEAVFQGALEGPAGATERRRALAELLLERYGIVTREQVLAEGIKGGFAMLYDTFANLEVLGVCRRGYFIEGMGGAQFALPGAVERLRAMPATLSSSGPYPEAGSGGESGRALVLAAADPAQPYGAALPWPKRQRDQFAGGRPARVAGAYVVLVEDRPVLYVERGGRGLVTLLARGPAEAARSTGPSGGSDADATRIALVALAQAVRRGRVGKLALERIDGAPALASSLASVLVELGFHPGPRRLTLTA
jgi:ATP-dependent helicase Lhr and Lhr-like helicase